MSRDELDIAVDWAAAEGWNPGLHDADAFYAADPSGFLVGTLDEEPVACISVVTYGDAFGFLGFYIVHPNHRGQGFGLTIWQAGMAYLGSRNVGLDGVVDQQANYERSGFRYAYGNQRYEGAGGGRMPNGVTPLENVPFEQITDYDRACFPAPRDAFLEHWVALPESVGYAVSGSAGLRGYAVLRRCRTGHKVGPLFADDAGTAAKLFAALRAAVPGEPLFLDVPLPNAAAVSLAETNDMQPVFETARMYTGGEPDIDLGRVFGVTTFELG